MKLKGCCQGRFNCNPLILPNPPPWLLKQCIVTFQCKELHDGLDRRLLDTFPQLWVDIILPDCDAGDLGVFGCNRGLGILWCLQTFGPKLDEGTTEEYLLTGVYMECRCMYRSHDIFGIFGDWAQCKKTKFIWCQTGGGSQPFIGHSTTGKDDSGCMRRKLLQQLCC